MWLSSQLINGYTTSPECCVARLIAVHLGWRTSRSIYLCRTGTGVSWSRSIQLIYSPHVPFLKYRLDFVIWFVPSLIGDAIAVSIIGLLLGPMFPIAMNQSARILPPWILTGSIGWIAGFGQAGSALFPFIAGAVAQNHGIKTLHPM